MKRTFTLVLAMLMMLMLCIPAFAAEQEPEPTYEGKITVNNTVAGETYTIYRMADLVSFSGTSFSYKITSGWENFFASAPSTNWFEVNENGYLVQKHAANFTDEGKEAMGKGAQVYATTPTNNITATATKVADGTTVVFDNLPLGWYLLDSSLGVLCSVDTTAKEVVINEKNDEPIITKLVQEDSDLEWGTANSAAIHQDNNFRIRIDVAPGAVNYVAHDTMTNMTLKDVNADGTVDAKDFTVTRLYRLNDQTQTQTVPAANYTVTVGALTTADDGTQTQTFEIKFADSYITTLSANDFIEIGYVTNLTDSAVIGNPGNPNDVYLTYGNASTSEHAQTLTYTYAFDLVKTDSTGKLLDGATFKLYIRNIKEVEAQDGGATAQATEYVYHEVKLVKDADNSYHVAGPGETPADVIVVKNGGKTNIRGLDLDTFYALQEIEAPEGYNVLADYTTVRLTSTTGSLLITHDLSDGMYQTTYGGVQVINKTGTELPETGGFGTTMFVVIGSILVVGAGILLATKARMAKMAE